ncbi:MAG TPA: hypothetical protein VEQ16_09385 [Acidocella sp.]|nr:hypothetical protein [Acidocella sp.]
MRRPRSLAQKLLWFLALWLMGVASVALLSLLMHLWLVERI